MSFIYHLEFEVIPSKFEEKSAETFFSVAKNKEYFFELFNNFYKMLGKKIKFKKRDFGMYDFDLGDGYHVIYASLPSPNKHDLSDVYCMAYCMPYEIYDDVIKTAGLYTIEMSKFGTNCIGQSINGNHYNYGTISQTLKETVAKVGNIAFDRNFKIK